MNDQVRTLTIRQVLDAGAHVSGARSVEAANRSMVDSARAVATEYRQVQVVLSSSSDPVSRLTRAYDSVGAAQNRFTSDLTGLNRALDTGKVSAEQAAAIYAGMVNRLGMMADGAHLAGQSFAQLGGIVEETNRAIMMQATAARATAIAAQETQQYAQRVASLRAQIDPVGTSQARLNAELAEYVVMMNRADISTQEFAQAQTLAIARHEEFVASLNRSPANDNGAVPGSREAQYRRQNLGMQLFDVGQTAALGMNPMMILAQQGPQIAQLYAMQGGLNAAMRDFSVILGAVARVAGPIVGILAGVYGAYRLLSSYSAEAAVSVSDATRALAAQAAPISSLENQIRELAAIQKTYSDAIGTVAAAQDAATQSIVANSQREFEAKKALLELELRRQEAAVAVQQSELAIASLQIKKEVAEQVATDPGRMIRDGYADPAINGGIPFVRVPDSITGLEKTMEVIANSPAAEKVKEINANLTLMQIVVDKLREGVKQVFNPRTGDPVPFFPNGVPIPSPRPLDGADEAASIAKTEKAYDQLVRASEQRIASLRNEISLMGESVAARAQLRAEFEAEAQYREAVARAGGQVDAREIALLREKAALVAQLNQQLSAARMLEDQTKEIEQLRLEASLVGASARERATMTAALQAEQQLRQAGISLISAEGQAYRDNAVAMANARLEIERQNAAYTSLQQSGGSAIDALTTGTGSLQDRLKSAADSMLQWVQQLAIANPLKNQLLGTNLPTIGDLFSGKSAMPGATTTGTMMVTAGTVMLNGGVMSDMFKLPGTTTGGGLGDLLGYKPASTATTNPALAGLVNDPSLASRVAANVNTAAPSGSIEAYIRQSAIQRGIDPNIAVRVAQSEGGLNSWNRQSDFINAAGQREQSYGPFQMYMGGGLGNRFQRDTGLDPRLAANGPAATDYALDVASKEGWGAWYGARKAGISDWQGIGKNPGIDPATTNSTTNALKQLSVTTSSASKDVSGLGDSTAKLGTSLTENLGKLSTPAAVPQMPVATPTAAASNPISSFFGGIFKLFGFADGTDFAPGGLAMVGERGPELVSLPRGSKVTQNHKIGSGGEDMRRGGGGPVQVNVGVSMDKNGNLEAYVKDISQSEAAYVSQGVVSAYDSVLPDRLEAIRQAPFDR